MEVFFRTSYGEGDANAVRWAQLFESHLRLRIARHAGNDLQHLSGRLMTAGMKDGMSFLSPSTGLRHIIAKLLADEQDHIWQEMMARSISDTDHLQVGAYGDGLTMGNMFVYTPTAGEMFTMQDIAKQAGRSADYFQGFRGRTIEYGHFGASIFAGFGYQGAELIVAAGKGAVMLASDLPATAANAAENLGNFAKTLSDSDKAAELAAKVGLGIADAFEKNPGETIGRGLFEALMAVGGMVASVKVGAKTMQLSARAFQAVKGLSGVQKAAGLAQRALGFLGEKLESVVDTLRAFMPNSYRGFTGFGEIVDALEETGLPTHRAPKLRKITPTGDIDPQATLLGNKFGGQASVKLEGFGNREFDFISSRYVGQSFGGEAVATKPNNFLTKARKAQIRETIRAARETGRRPLFNFEGVQPHEEVIDFIRRNCDRMGIEPVLTNIVPRP